MNKYSLSFNNPIQEKQYRMYITTERGKPLRIIITLQSFNEFIMLSTVVYYFLKDMNNFGKALDFIIYQIIIFLSNSLLAVSMLYKLIDFGHSSILFILIHIVRVILTLYMPGFFEHQLQFFSQFQYGYSCFLIVIIVTFQYSFIFKTASILLLNSAVFFLYEYEYNNFYTMSFISAVLCYKVFTDEKTFRQDFLMKQKMEKWMLIVDRVIPSSLFITKFNPREELIELSQSNQKAKNQFDVKNSEQFQAFIARTFLDKNSEEIAANNNQIPPNNLKVRIRNLIENEKQSFQNQLQQRKTNDGVQKLKSLTDQSHRLVTVNYAHQSAFASDRIRSESRNSQNLGYSANLNNIPLPFRNKVLQNKKLRGRVSMNTSLRNQQDNNSESEHSSFQQLQNENGNDKESEKLNLSSPQPISRKSRKVKTIKNRQYIQKNNQSHSNDLSPATNNTNNILLGINFLIYNFIQKKRLLQEGCTFRIIDVQYKAVQLLFGGNFQSNEDRIIREKNKLRDFQINSNRFVNDLSLQARNMFAELRNQQIFYLNQNESEFNYEEMKEQNMRAINHCFGIINCIDNFIVGHNSIPNVILEDEIKNVNLNQLFDNLMKVLQLQKEERRIKCVIYNTYKKDLLSSSKYLTQLLFNILNLSFQVCAENGLIQVEVKEINKTFYTSYIQICIKHTLKEEQFSIFNFCEQQRMVFETSKKLLELVSPYSKFFIKQRKNFYAQIKFYIYRDLNEINHLNKARQTMYHNIYQTIGGQENHLIEQEECQSDDLSLEQTDTCINQIEEIKQTHQNALNLSKQMLTSQPQTTEAPIKLSIECHEDDLNKSERQNLKFLAKPQTSPMTQSIFVEGISGYKIPFRKLFEETQKNDDQDDQEYDEYDDDGDQEDIFKSEQDSSLQNQDSRIDKFQKQKRGQKNSSRRNNKNDQSLKSDEKRTMSNTDSPSNSKKRFSSRLDTHNSTLKSQHNIRSKKNSCFNENNNTDTYQGYLQNPQKQQITIKETEEELAKSMTSNQFTNPYNSQEMHYQYNTQLEQRSKESSFQSMDKSKTLSIDNQNSDQHDEIKECQTFESLKNGDNFKSSFLNEKMNHSYSNSIFKENK